MNRISRVALLLALVAPAPVPAWAQTPAPALHYGRWGLDLEAVDPGVSPGDDFFAHANGKWLARTPIPPDSDRATLRQLGSLNTLAQLQALLQEAAQHAGRNPATDADKVGAFYKSFIDEAHIETLGSTPLGAALAEVRRAATREQLAALMGRAPYGFQNSPFGIGIGVDPREPGRYAVFVDQAGLGLPNRDFYLVSDFAGEKSAYRDHAERLLRLIAWHDPAAAATDIVAFESRIAEASWSRAANRDLESTYNPMTIGELEALAPGFPWRAFLGAAWLGHVDRVIVGQKSAFAKIAAILGDTPIETLQAWLAFTMADGAAPYLSTPFNQAAFEFRDKALNGLVQPQARARRAVRAVAGDFNADSGTFGNMGWAVGQLYVERHFSSQTKAQVEALVRNVIAAFRIRLQRAEWMSAPTRAEALRKLDAYAIKVGYPSKARDYSRLVIRDDDLVGNVLRTARLEWDVVVDRLGRPVDREEWLLTPQTDNAFNTGAILAIEFPAALLQAPMFDPNADAAVNYGAIGAFIGHEITHGFDDQGRKLDAEGRLRNWWALDDATQFERRAATLGTQYASYEPLPGLFVDAKATMGENIADLGGVAVALDAYRASLGGRPAPVIDGLTGDQRFFLGWAQAWRGKLTDEATRALVKGDSHSPRNLRVNGIVRNIDDWYGAFGVSPGARLYLAPDDRARIW